MHNIDRRKSLARSRLMNQRLGFRFENAFPLLCGLAILLSRNEISAEDKHPCTLLAEDESFSAQVREIIDESNSNAANFDGESLLFLTHLLNYDFKFPDRKGGTPLETNFKNVYKPNQMYRVLSRHGATLMDLAFNFEVVSLMTLTIGIKKFKVPLVERPPRCLDGLNEKETMDVVLYLVARDFNAASENHTLAKDDKVCVKYIENVNGQAKFVARCFLGDSTKNEDQQEKVMNRWLFALYIVVAIVRLILLFFGPMLLIGFAASLSNQSAPYIVRLKEPLYRSMFIAKSLKDFERVRGRRILNLSKCRGFPKMKESLLTCPMGVPFMAEIVQYDILVANKRLIKENEVPVTVWSALVEAIFTCKIKNTSGIRECCYSDMFKSIPWVRKKVIWLSCCYKIGMLLLVLFMPFPYYLRLIIFYIFEQNEFNARLAAVNSLNLTKEFDNNLLLYFKPNHPLFITVYVVYFVSAVCLALLTQRDHEDRFRNIVVGSFEDLERLSYLRVLRMVTENILWPFRRFGCLGVFVALVYWIVFIPLNLIITIGYSLPTVYLFVRMIFYSRKAFLQTIRTRSGIRKYQANAKVDESIEVFKTEFLLDVGSDKNASAAEPRSSGLRTSGPQEVDEMEKFRAAEKKSVDKDSVASSIIHKLRIKPKRFAMHVLSAVFCVISLISLLIIVSECVGELTEIAVFTMMGIIVNAGVTVRYVALCAMIILYTCSCFNGVRDKYLHLNASLFPEIKSRIADLFDVTALPSHLQENQAFKSQEQSQQAAHELSDDIAEMPSRHWLINDLVLFVDNQDTFRIPRRLFKSVCEIEVAGVPGPIHTGIIEAFVSFLKMLIFILFVFVIIQCFGNITDASNSTQTLAIVGCGCIPLLMDSFMGSNAPEVEVNTLSFTSKLDEVIKNFWQLWPIHDFAFRVAANTALPGYQPQKLIVQKGKPEEQGGLNTVATVPTLQMESEVGTDQKAKSIPENTNMHNPAYKARILRQGFRTKPAAVLQATAVGAIIAGKLKPQSDVPGAIEDTEKDEDELQEAAGTAAAPTPAAGEDTQVDQLRAAVPLPATTKAATTKAIDLIIDKQKATIELVDILIRVPAKYEDQWIDGWSNIVDYRDVKKDKRESDIADAMLGAAAKSRESGGKRHIQGEDLASD